MRVDHQGGIPYIHNQEIEIIVIIMVLNIKVIMIYHFSLLNCSFNTCERHRRWRLHEQKLPLVMLKIIILIIIVIIIVTNIMIIIVIIHNITRVIIIELTDRENRPKDCGVVDR